MRDSSLSDEVPQTPTTPVSAETFTSLYNLIKKETLTLNETSIPQLQRHIQKLASAGQQYIASCALLNEKNQLMMKVNNEAKVRRSTRSVVLGKAKVMSYEDIEEARNKRAAKDATKGKGKRGRKRKNATSEKGKPNPDPDPDLDSDPGPEPELEPGPEPEPEPEMVCATKKARKNIGKRARKHASTANAAEPEPASESEPEVVSELAQIVIPQETWSAPVAHMY